MLYYDLWWCMHALGLVWEEGRAGEMDERGTGRGVKGRGVSWLFVLHCSHPCDQSREETFRALLQERHVVFFFFLSYFFISLYLFIYLLRKKGSTTLKKNQLLYFASRMTSYNRFHFHVFTLQCKILAPVVFHILSKKLTEDTTPSGSFPLISD